MRHRFTGFFFTLFSIVFLVVGRYSFFFYADAQRPTILPSDTATATFSITPTPFSSSTATPSPSFSPSPTPTPTLTPSPSVTPTPTPTGDAFLNCDATWDLVLDYDPSKAVRNGQVDFTLTFPGNAFGRVPHNPRLSDAYQYPYTPVSDSLLVITSGEQGGLTYTGNILMKSADAVIMKFDLWCLNLGTNAYEVVRTYTWTIPQGGSPLPSPSPNATLSDIRYVSFSLAIDADVAHDPLGIFIESQVQLRNLKSNL